MSRLNIETTKTTEIGGITYKAEINQTINIDFSAANYTVRIWEDGNDTEIELISDSMDFLDELTGIFPLQEYSIRIVQKMYRHTKPHVSPYFDIKNKATGKKVFIAEPVMLSDKDHDYIRNILAGEVPQYKWQTREAYLRGSIEQYLGEIRTDELFTDDAFHFLSRMVSAKWKEMKTDGYIDFETSRMESVAKEILEEALREAYDAQKGGKEE